jgi:hypothetical protein
MVVEHGGFSEDEADDIRSKFSLTTLQRLMDSKEVRAALGLSVASGQLCSGLPGSELIKPLKRIIRDIADKKVDSRRLNTTEKMTDYVRGFGKADKPDFSKAGTSRPIEGIQKAEFVKARSKSGAAKRSASPQERRHVVPKNCSLNVTSNRIAEIYEELRTLKLETARNAIAVLQRVFLEMSVDHFLESNSVSLRFTPPNSTKEVWKKLDKKLSETVDILLKVGVPKNAFRGTHSLTERPDKPDEYRPFPSLCT